MDGCFVTGACRWTIGLYRGRVDGRSVCTGTNLFGPERMVEAFLPLLDPTEGTPPICRWTSGVYRQRLDGRLVCTGGVYMAPSAWSRLFCPSSTRPKVRAKGQFVPGVCRWTIGLYQQRGYGRSVCTGAV